MSLFSARWSAVHPDDSLATCPVEGWHGTHLKSAHITAHLSLSEPQSRSSEKKRQRFGHPSRSAMWDDFEGPSAFQGHNLLLSEWVRWLSSICHSSLDVQNPNAKGLTFFLFGQQIEVNTLYLKWKPLVNFLLLRFLQKNLSDLCACM